MTGLSPARGRGEALGWALSGAAGAVCVLAGLLPWVQAPIGFEELQVSGAEKPQGLGVVVLGVFLAATAIAGWRRPDRRFSVELHATFGVALIAVLVVSWVEVDRVLEREVPDIGVHPGSHGPGLRLVGVAAGLLLGAALWVWRARVSAAPQRARER